MLAVAMACTGPGKAGWDTGVGGNCCIIAPGVDSSYIAPGQIGMQMHLPDLDRAT